ncbi:hypothetical protein EKD04_007590 [Chloroflexales bacterium ZM16-3]|nr:hypothetical protein [Chloroflexales bacterium ZM16-3]
MLTPSSLAFFHGGRTARRVRSDAQRQIHEEPAVRLLPGLLDIPLATAPIPDPDAILASRGGIALCGLPGSGRSLALLQIQARWASSGAGGSVIAISLAVADVPNLSPRAVVAGAIHRAGLPATHAEGGRPMLLLLDDWEDLPADRRAIWRSYAITAAAWPVARLVISLPPGEEWPGLTSINLAAPDDDELAIWLVRLLPGHDVSPILAALRREPLAALRHSVSDLLLLALIYPIAGIPDSRSQLYEQAYALAHPLLDAADRRISIGRVALRHYRLARSLAGGQDLAALAALPAHEIAAVAPLAAGLLGDPRPVLRLLWGDGDPSPSALRGLAACLRERPADAPDQGLRLIELLNTSDYQDLWPLIAPGLPDMFAAVASGDQERATRALCLLAERQPGHPLADLLLMIIDRPDADEALRWAAADLLAGQPEQPAALADMPAVADEIARAARAHIIAIAAPSLRNELLGAALRPGLDAIIAGLGGEGRKAATCAALLDDPPCADELRALALSSVPTRVESAPLLQRTLADPSPALRHSALAALASLPADEALRLLGAAIAAAEHDDAARIELLAAAAQLPQREATGLIARYALAERAGVALRIGALRLLATRPDSAPLLLRFLSAARIPELLRAVAAILLGEHGDVAVAPHLRHTLLGDGPPILRRASAAALAALARTPGGRESAVATLIDALARPEPDAALTVQIATSLGALGVTAAIPALSTLLGSRRPTSLRAGWLAAVSALTHTPAERWSTIPLDPNTRAVLIDSLATGETEEDQPSSLDELGIRQAAQTALAAADALAAIAEQRPDLAADLCSRIRHALLHVPGPQPAAGLLGALARAAGAEVAAELEAILDSPEGTPSLRWAALDQLGRNPTIARWALERLNSGGDDPFTQGKLVTTLGELGDQRAIPALRQISARSDADLHIRTLAVAALGQLGGDEADTALRAIISAGDAPAPLRAAAVAALPPPLSDETRHTLHQIARAEGGLPDLAAAIGSALAGAGERTILPLLLRTAQSERAEHAVCAIDAIGELGDQSAAPLLVRISQAATAAPGVRLAAIAALLRLDGPAHLPLLRSHIDSPIPPLRIRAHQILAKIAPGDPQLFAPVSDISAPLALRLAALERLMADHPTLSLVGAILKRADEPPQLRLCVARGLGRSDRPEAARMLLEALGTDGPPLLRRHCVLALGQLVATPGAASVAALAALATLVQGDETPAEVRHWAAEIILNLALHRAENDGRSKL